MQRRIAIAAVSQDWHKVRDLQQMLFQSYDAKMTAVQRVTSKQTKRTPGIDGLFWSDDGTELDDRNVHTSVWDELIYCKSGRKTTNRKEDRKSVV